MSFSSLDIRNIAKLLSEAEGSEHSENINSDDDSVDEPLKGSSRKEDGPDCIYSKNSSDSTSNDDGKKVSSTASTEKLQKGIWDEKEAIHDDEVATIGSAAIKNDPRKRPTYRMYYRQCVTSEDIFLQMSNKTPATASCEELVVEIRLPNDDFHNVQLNLHKQALDIRSPIHFLYLNLPHPINPRAGNAKWDQASETLTVTLKLQREYDTLNF